MSKKKSASGGITLSTLVFLVFLIMKLAKIGAVADWSWLWVTCPLWIGLAIVAAVLIVILIIAIITDILL